MPDSSNEHDLSEKNETQDTVMDRLSEIEEKVDQVYHKVQFALLETKDKVLEQSETELKKLRQNYLELFEILNSSDSNTQHLSELIQHTNQDLKMIKRFSYSGSTFALIQCAN